MADHVKDTLAALARAPSSLAEVIRRELPRGGQSWALRLVLALEEDPPFGAPGEIPSWQQALFTIDSLEKRGAPIAALTDAQWTDRFAQAVALWLGFTGGHPPRTQLEDWMGDSTRRSAPVGLLLVPFLTDPDERDLCLQLAAERCDALWMAAFSRRWLEAHGAPLVASIAARLRESSPPIVAEKWARVLVAAAPKHPEAMDELISYSISGEASAHHFARDVARTASTETLAALARREPGKEKKKARALAEALAEDCRLLEGLSKCADDAEKQRFLEEALSADFPAPSRSRPVARLLPRGPMFAALRKIRHPATRDRAQAEAFTKAYVWIAGSSEDPRVHDLELLGLDWHARAEDSQRESDRWFDDLVKQRRPGEVAPFDAMLAAALGESCWEERIGAVLDEIEAEIEAREDAKRARKEEIQARREQAREAARARFAPAAAKLIQERPGWVGKSIVICDKPDLLRLDLAKLYRCGWRGEETEESHKFVRYLVRKVDGQRATLRVNDDIYWDEIPKHGARIATIHLPDPFGARTPAMERIVGEIAAARMLDAPTPTKA